MTSCFEKSEPTTENIAKALRVCFEKTCACSECPFEHESCGDIEQLAADRLERQEREISVLRDVSERQDARLISQEGAHIETMRELSGITGEFERFRAFHERYAEQTSKKYVEEICALTARAESAERERDAAIADLKFLDRCKTCFHAKTRHLIGSECKTCKALSNFKWRGLQPQDGAGR